MQVFEKERVEVKKIKVETFKAMLDMGATADSANEYLETDFEIEEKPETDGEETEEGNTESESGGAEGSEEGEAETTDE